jgi:hypothetical protein
MERILRFKKMDLLQFLKETSRFLTISLLNQMVVAEQSKWWLPSKANGGYSSNQPHPHLQV